MIRYETDGAVATITIDDPDRRNPIGLDEMAALRDAVDAASVDEAVRVVVITGAGGRAFSAGGDISGRFVDAPLADHGGRGAFADLLRALRRCPKPVVARVNGHALGGGFGLVAGSDIAIAVESATLGTPEIDIGLWPMMITAVLQPLVPRRALLAMMLEGRRITATEARKLGIINRVVATGDLDAAVDETVERLLAKSPSSLALGKTAFYAVADMDFDTALDYLHTGLTAVALTEDAAEGIAAFTEKRDPEWKGR